MAYDVSRYALNGPESLDEKISDGGIYTAKAIREMDKLSQMPRLKVDIGVELSQQARPGAVSQGHMNPQDLFPELPDLDFAWFGTWWSYIDHGVRLYFLCSVLWKVGKFFTWIWGLSWRYVLAVQTFGKTPKLASILIPSQHDYYLATRGRRLDEEEAQEEQRASGNEIAMRKAEFNHDNSNDAFEGEDPNGLRSQSLYPPLKGAPYAEETLPSRH